MVMTLAILATGGCQIVTAVALRPAALPGRCVLAVGGACTALVALNPLPSPGGHSALHSLFATGAFSALALWPLISWVRGSSVPWGLRRTVAICAGCGLVALTGWFFGEALAGGSQLGLAERVAAASQTLWPMVVALSARRR
jgi:hypothetical protein